MTTTTRCIGLLVAVGRQKRSSIDTWGGVAAMVSRQVDCFKFGALCKTTHNLGACCADGLRRVAVCCAASMMLWAEGCCWQTLLSPKTACRGCYTSVTSIVRWQMYSAWGQKLHCRHVTFGGTGVGSGDGGLEYSTIGLLSQGLYYTDALGTRGRACPSSNLERNTITTYLVVVVVTRPPWTGT